MKRILALIALLVAVEVSAQLKPNKFDTNTNPEAVGWVNTSAQGIGGNLNITNGGWVFQNTNNTSSNMTFNVFPATTSLPGGGFNLVVSSSRSLLDGNLFTVFVNPVHGSTTPSVAASEVQIFAGGNLAYTVGYQQNNIRHIQKGIGNGNPNVPGQLSFNPWTYGQWAAPFNGSPGYSWVDAYKVSSLGSDHYPGIMSRGWTNNDGFGGYWELSLIKDLNATVNPLSDFWSVDAISDGAGYRVYTNGYMEGFYHRGGLLQSQSSLTTSSATVPLSFGNSMASVLFPSAASVTLYTTNSLANSTNYERRVFVIKANGNLITNIVYPAWNVPTNIIPITSLPVDYALRLELESYGSGETNKYLISETAALDRTFSLDADAANFLTRVALTNSTTDSLKISAVNTFVKALKAGDCWTNFIVIYLPLTTNAGWNGENLKGNTFDMTWSGTVVHTNSVGFDGSTGFGNTGYNPTTTGGWIQNSACLAIYSGTVSIGGANTVLGGAMSGTERGYLMQNGGNALMAGLNNNLGNGTIVPGGNTSGLWMANRTGSAQSANSLYLRALSFTDSSGGATTGNINQPIYFGCRNADGTAGNFTSYNFRLGAGGSSLGGAPLAAFQAAVANLATALGWP